MSATAIHVTDMHCAACVRKIEADLRTLSFVDSIRINPVRRLVHVTHQLQSGDFELLQRIEALGFAPQLRSQAAVGVRQDNKRAIKQLGIAGICMMQIMMATLGIYFGEFWGMQPFARDLLNWACLVFSLPIMGYSAVPFFRGALGAVQRGMNMDVPVAIAIVLAFTVSVWNLLSGKPETYFDSVAMFTFLLLGARQIDAALKRKVSADDLAFQQASNTVARWDQDRWQHCDIDAVLAGDRLRVNEGATFPVDATLLDDRAVIDEASLSGESQWVNRLEGEVLYAGTINRGAAVQCRATGPAVESRAARIQHLADRIDLEQAPFGRLANRVAGWFVPTVLIAAACTTIGWTLLGSEQAVRAGLAVLIVSCPCALALAIPAALTAAMAHLRRCGLLLADSGFVELAPAINQLYVDKTGTLTLPDLTLQQTELLGSKNADYCRTLAASLQRYSSHPIARAFANISDQTDWELSDVETVPGQGVRGRYDCAGNLAEVRIGSAEFCGAGQTQQPGTIMLSMNGEPLARFTLGADLRSDAANAIARLQQRGLHITMLSGDQEAACALVAHALQIEYRGAMQPEDKCQYLQDHRGANDKALYVGDGINDALAFSAADMAIATLETTDLVRTRADGTLLTAQLHAIADLFDTADKTRQVMHQNLFWAVIYNLIAIPSAMLGLMPPWLAAIGMACSSILVLLNATRLLGAPTQTGVAG
ncbi:MAG: heavy metal translocating P-type ATPase [Pseudomonadales bacterium]